MRKCYILLTALLCSYSIYAQVGINTDNPQATLDVQKSTNPTRAMGILPPRVTGDELRLNANLYGTAQNGAIVYVTTPITASTEPKTLGVTTRGLFIYDALEPNGNGNGLWQILPDGPATPTATTGDGAYAAKFSSTFNLLGLSVGNSLVELNIGGTTGGTTTVQVPSTSMSNGVYTVPSTGIYQIKYQYKEGSGANVNLLTNSGIRILRTPVGSTTASILDSKGFGGVSVALVLTVSITETTINHLYNLTAGDKIQFGIDRQSLAGVSLATAAEADISIYRVK